MGELIHYKRKYQEYKHKLKLANLKISEFGSRLVRLQSERVALHEGFIPGEFEEEDPHREEDDEEHYMAQ